MASYCLNSGIAGRRQANAEVQYGVRDFMRQAKEVFQRHVSDAVTGEAGAWDGEPVAPRSPRTAAQRSGGTSEGK